MSICAYIEPFLISTYIVVDMAGLRRDFSEIAPSVGCEVIESAMSAHLFVIFKGVHVDNILLS